MMYKLIKRNGDSSGEGKGQFVELWEKQEKERESWGRVRGDRIMRGKKNKKEKTLKGSKRKTYLRLGKRTWM